MSQYPFSVTVLFDVGLKASFLLLIIWLVSLLLRRLSPAVQHRWWTLGFVGCLLIPAINVAKPKWTLPMTLPFFADSVPVSETPIVDTSSAKTATLPTTDGNVPVSETTRLVQHAPIRRLPSSQQPTTLDRPKKSLSEQPITGTEISSSASGIATNTPNISLADRSSWTNLILTLWAVGTVFCWSRIAWRHLLLKRFLNGCVSFENASLNELLAESSRLLGIRRPVSLLSHEAPHSPMSVGLWRPALVLPIDAKKWTPDRQRSVLLHELAHVSRCDVLTQAVSGLTCGLYWFNPLSWYGLSRMRYLREFACDDLVLRFGQQPSDYADVLLDVARSSRHHRCSTVVCMAQRTNVEQRIQAILDSERRHVLLSRTAARRLLVISAVFVCFVGTAQLQSQDARVTSEAVRPFEGVETLGKTGAEDNDGSPDLGPENTEEHQIRISVLDDSGQPLPGAKIFANRVRQKATGGDRIVNSDLFADDAGMITLPIDRKHDTVKLWASSQGKVSEFVYLKRAPDQQDAVLPSDYEFRLAEGTTIGGVVVDDDDKPIANVQVRVQTREHGSSYEAKVNTDAEGRWRHQKAPGPIDGRDYQFSIKLNHPDYSSDSRWGGLQRAQGVTTKQLRSGDAKIVMSRGPHVEGKVVDFDGNPITKGWVVWHDEPYFNDGDLETEISADGTFRTPTLEIGEHPITVVAPGYAAQRRVVQLNGDSHTLRFELRPGKRIEIRFVDTAGNPVPRVGVGLAQSSVPDTWNNSNALHNHKHSNVPDYGIPRRSDWQGVFVWDWAPEEPVTYSIGAKGFAPQKVALVAKSTAHVVTMAGARVVTGLVTDAVKGTPIERFRAMPVIVFRPNFFSTRFVDLKQGESGLYELPLTGSGDPDDHYRVRIEADGYRTVISEESFGPLDGRVELNVELEPVPRRKGRVVDRQGKPIAGAMVIESTPTWTPRTRNGEPNRYGERIVQADSDGSFELNATTEPTRVRVIHDDGISEKLVSPEEGSIGDMQLEPWAKASGRLVQDGQPIGDQIIYFNPLVKRGLGEARFQDSYYAQTSADGRFSFERLPPVAGRLRTNLGPWDDSPLTSSESLTLEPEPGEKHEVELGGDGAVVTGRVVATGRQDAPLNRKWSINYLVSRERGVGPPYPDGFPNLSFDPSGPMQASWCLDSHFHDWLATREHHFVKLTPDGHLRVTGVAPGEYDLVIRLYEQPAGCLVETVGEKVIPVRVESIGEIDLGKIEVPCRTGPRVGSDMRAFKFVDASGRKRLVDDMSGRYVLMHVWASWCAPCLEQMPSIKHTAASNADLPVTFVGLNIDKDSKRAEELANRSGWAWPQNYLGEDSDMARQLAISSAPAYYLIGPDGLLAAASTEWSKMKTMLTSALDDTSN